MTVQKTIAWPPDYLAEYKRRITACDEARRDPMFRSALQVFYKENPVEFINDWCITIDPRAKSPNPKLMPFVLFPRQIEFIHFLQECLRDKQSGLCEKSRDVGASWLCVCFAVWMWLFHGGCIIGFGSRKEEYVDHRGDPKAIFPKIREVLNHIPDFLMPAGFTGDKHATYMRIINPVNGAAIIGEAGSSQGRGGRSTIYFKDESAHYEQAELIEAALGDNTDVQIDISSVNGTNNVFYGKRMAGEVWYPDQPPIMGKTRIFIFDWSDNPAKTKEWHAARRAKAEAEGLLHIFAQEVERNYSSAVDRLIIQPDWVNACIDAHKVLGIKPSGDKTAGQDVADEGGDKNALAIRHGIVLRHIDSSGGDPNDAAIAAIPHCVEYGVNELYYDSIGVGAGFKVAINNMKERGAFPLRLRVMPWNAGAHVLDPDSNIIPGDTQSPTNEDQYENLKAQSWFRMRTRCYKTYRAVRFGEKYPENELISFDSTMPRIHELRNELCQAQYKSSKNGKTMVDKKPNGAKSPNLADAVVICYSPTRELSIFDVL